MADRARSVLSEVRPMIRTGGFTHVRLVIVTAVIRPI